MFHRPFLESLLPDAVPRSASIVINTPGSNSLCCRGNQFTVMLEPPSTGNSVDAENFSEIILMITIHSITGDGDGLAEHHCWDATTASGCAMVIAACAALSRCN